MIATPDDEPVAYFMRGVDHRFAGHLMSSRRHRQPDPSPQQGKGLRVQRRGDPGHTGGSGGHVWLAGELQRLGVADPN